MTIEDNLEMIKEIRKSIKVNAKAKTRRIYEEQAIFQQLMESSPKCARCGRDKNLSLDHIVPRAVLEEMGVDIEREIVLGNYQLLCKPCNTFKGNRLDFSIPQTKEIMLELLKDL